MYGIYARTRIDALYDPVTSSVTIPSGPGAGHYKSPSGALTAVIQTLRPAVQPNRTGWTFWRITSSGKPISTLRTTTDTASAPALVRHPTPPTPPTAVTAKGVRR